MIRKALLELIFQASQMQRWNDKLRPIELFELDKQGHKMIAAWVLGKFHEGDEGFDWIAVIEGGIFEFFQRMILTDLKPPIFYKIKADPEKYRQLNAHVFEKLKPVLAPLGEAFLERFRRYFEAGDEDINRRILGGAHIYASRWEFEIIRRANPEGYEMDRIGGEFQALLEGYCDLRGMGEVLKYRRYRDFLDLCGELRFQIRWANLHRVPKTSVIGHSFIVAVLSYLFSLQIGACPRRRVNNYFTGLFHDLPEVLTRDILSPVKRSVAGLEDLIKDYEREMMAETVYTLLPEEWHEEMRLFTETEFEGVITREGRRETVDSTAISAAFNEDRFDPRDGELIKAVDRLAAFVEADLAVRNGSASQEFRGAACDIRAEYEGRDVAGIPFGSIYEDFNT